MNEREIDVDELVVSHGGAIVECVLAGLRDGATVERIVVLWVHKSFLAHDEVRAWLSDDGVRDLDADGFVCGLHRPDARAAMRIGGMFAVADQLEGERSSGGFALVVLFRDEARIRHIEIERPRVEPFAMVKGGAA